MNRFFEDEILALCENLLLKIQVAPEMFPGGLNEQAKQKLGSLRLVIESIRRDAQQLCTENCKYYGALRIPRDPQLAEALLDLQICTLEHRLENKSPTENPWVLLFREDLQKLLELLQKSQAALRETITQWDTQVPVRVEGLDPFGPVTSWRGEDACRSIVVPEEQPAPPPVPHADPQKTVFISYSRREEQNEQTRLLQEEMIREMARLHRENAHMAPGGQPQSAMEWYRGAADAGTGMPLPSAPAPVARDDATKPPQKVPKKEQKGLFERLLERKKNQKKQSKTDDVQFRAAAPAMIRPGAFFPVKVMMYREEDHARADREQNALGEQVKASSGSVLQARQDQLFRIALRSPDLPALFESDTLRWNGRYAAVDLDLLLPADFDKDQLRLHCRVYDEDAVVNDLKVILQVNATQPQDLPCEKCVFRSAFISYASEDREQVANRIQGIELAAPHLDLFFDVKDLNRGEHWEPRLYQEIEKRDLFYLFWSKNAAASPWVAKELQHAIAHKGLDRIEPVPLETPEECPPPEQLRDRHFNDWTLRYRKK